ncbi:uncharacterized protein LOC133831909 [Humulus lupulus]|uniref:uncharacterized protein LOC133831909 n=1 Tax=Humulus lupulus TaxID=3486 RepID=UPI002B402C17|nr:uncharacterized protein LOC133831909 [Humulus lupulus]
MSSEDVFEHYKAAAASSSKKKNNKRVRGESCKTASKKAQTEGPSAAVPSKENMPPPSPLDQPPSTPPVDQHPTPPAPSDQPHRLLTIIAGWRRAGAMVFQTKNFYTRLTEAMKALEGKNADLLEKNTELTKQNDELLEKNIELNKQNDELLEQKATLTEELLESRAALNKSNEDKEKFRESAKLNYQQSKQLELDLTASRKETEELERRVKELEETDAKNLENYLSKRLRQTLMSQCTIRLEEEERVKIPASPEISLATGIDSADNEAGTVVDQNTPQNPPAL